MALEEIEKKRKLILISTVVSVVLISIGLVTGEPSIIMNLLVISVFVFVVPLFVYKYSQYVWLKSLEEEFPNFVRALADSVRSGTSFEDAISLATKSDYGKLTREIKKMDNRLQWGTDFIRVIDIFGKKVQDSKIITESLEIIKEAYKSGGRVAKTLDTIARNIMLFKEVEAERESMVRQHVMIMYGIFFMFLGISVITIFVMVPMVQTKAGATGAGGLGLKFNDPCEGMYTTTMPCTLFSVIGVLLEMPQNIGLYYTALFFSISLLLGLFVGLIAGQLGENSILAGGKHSLIMLTIAITVFLFLAKMGMLPG